MVNTYLAASAAVLSSSPCKKGIFSESLSSVNEGIRASNLGRNVSLTWRYLGHIIRKCFSSSICCRSQCLQILCSRSLHVCLCLPLSISRSWSLNLYLERICLSLNGLINKLKKLFSLSLSLRLLCSALFTLAAETDTKRGSSRA